MKKVASALIICAFNINFSLAQADTNSVKINQTINYEDVTKMASKFDISGVHLGMSCQSASDILAKQFPKNAGVDFVSPNPSIMTGSVFVKGNSGSIPSEKFIESIHFSDPKTNSDTYLYCSSPIMGSVVLRIKRTVQYVDVLNNEQHIESPTPKTFSTQIYDKYGIKLKESFNGNEQFINFYIGLDGKVNQTNLYVPSAPDQGGNIRDQFDQNKYSIAGSIKEDVNNAGQIVAYTIDLYDMYNYKSNMIGLIKYLENYTKSLEENNKTKANL